MKILVFSDSHGSSSAIESVLEAHMPRVDHVIFLGDGLRDIEHVSALYPMLPFATVRGNCDVLCRDEPTVRQFSVCGVNLLCIHGHEQGVKSSLITAAYLGAERNADIVLFGHTHTPVNTLESVAARPIRLFNPGSIGRGYPSSYGIIEIKPDGSYTCRHEQP